MSGAFDQLAASVSMLVYVVVQAGLLAVIFLIPPVRRRARGSPQRLRIVIGVGLLATLLSFGWNSLVGATFESFGEFGVLFNNYAYANRAVATPAARRPISDLLGELWARQAVPPLKAASCYTDAAICSYIDTYRLPAGSDPYTWEGYIGLWLGALLTGLVCSLIVDRLTSVTLRQGLKQA